MCNEPSVNHRNSEPNDNKKLASKMGSEVMSLLQPQAGERILDLGCGSGDLTAEIAAAGAIPTGIDLSEEMVNRARLKHPDLDLQVVDACQYRTDVRYDAVFSHASLHWIKDAAAVTKSISLALREGGRFVTEFAGSGNVACLTSAIKQALDSHGYTWEGRNPWYHPSIGEYATLLEQNGFRVTMAQHFDGYMQLKGESGIRKWLDNFTDHFFPDVSSTDKISIYDNIEAQVKPRLYREGQWMIDISRLRIVAIKEHLI